MSAKDNYVCIIMAAGVLSREFADFIASAGEDYTPPKTIDQQDVLAVRAVCVHACACVFLLFLFAGWRNLLEGRHRFRWNGDGNWPAYRFVRMGINCTLRFEDLDQKGHS